MKKREETIDHLRALAMIWVIVVHCLYWGGFFENEKINLIKSFALFEMPLFFFVTGASNSFSRVDNYLRFVIKRYKRILVPYWIYAIICATLSIIHYEINDERHNIISIFVSWMIPVNKQITAIPYLTWALWFIPVYLCVILAIPFLKSIRASRYAIPFLFIHVFIFICVCYVRLGWIQNFVFYSWWTYIGLFYESINLRIKERYYRRWLRVVVYIGVVVLLALFYCGESMDMQYNKFPPNTTFGVYSVIMMSIILLLIPYINRACRIVEKGAISRAILSLFSTRSLTIFLYQTFAFYLTIRLTNLMIPGSGSIVGIEKSILCFVLTVLACSLLVIIFGRFENMRPKITATNQ